MLREGAGIRNVGRLDGTFKRLADTFNARRCPRRDNEVSIGRSFVLQETVGLGQSHAIDFTAVVCRGPYTNELRALVSASVPASTRLRSWRLGSLLYGILQFAGIAELLYFL